MTRPPMRRSVHDTGIEHAGARRDKERRVDHERGEEQPDLGKNWPDHAP